MRVAFLHQDLGIGGAEALIGEANLIIMTYKAVFMGTMFTKGSHILF
jgi:hypothetical protein